MRLYCISGLGADARAFQYIDFDGYEVIHLDYITPHAGELLPAYARRMVEHYHVEPNSWILGVSFGGMVAQEMASLVDPARLILVATIMSRREFRFVFRLVGHLHFDRLISPNLVARSGQLTSWIFGVKSDREKSLLLEILGDTDPVFVPWAVRAVMKWQPPAVDVPVTRIHGRSDRLFPFRKAEGVTHPIDGAGHLTIVGHADQVSEVLAELKESNK